MYYMRHIILFPSDFQFYFLFNMISKCILLSKRPIGRMEFQLPWVYRRMSSDLVVRNGPLYRRSPLHYIAWRIALWRTYVCLECSRLWFHHLRRISFLCIFVVLFSSCILAFIVSLCRFFSLPLL